MADPVDVPASVMAKATTSVPISRPGEEPATFSALMKKKRRSNTLRVAVTGDDNETKYLLFRVQAMGGREYDKLVETNPPTPRQKQANAAFNIDTFGPALIAACAVDPKLSEEQCQELWTNPEWSNGEILGLYFGCLELCSAGLDVPFSAGG